MADNQLGDELAPQDTPPAEESESYQVEDQVQVEDTDSEEQSEATSQNQTTEEETPKGEADDGRDGKDTKPSRIERRISQLVSKLKEVDDTKSEPPVREDKPLFTDEEMSEGTVDPNRLVERIKNTVQTEVQRAIQMDRINQQYDSAVKEHQSDLEGIKDIDPDLEAEAVAEYEAINYQTNPLTGEKVFVPAVKLSEIVNKIVVRATKLAEKMAVEIAEGNKKYLKDVSSSQAIPSSGNVSGSKSVKSDTNDFTEFEKAYSSQS